MTPRTYASPAAFKQALEQRLRTAARGGAAFARKRQLLVFDRFLARVAHVLGDSATLKGGLVLELRLERAGGKRTVPLEGWIRGPFEVDIEPGELLAQIQVPLAGPRTAFGYERFKALERPSLSVAVRLDAGEDGLIEGTRIVVGCVGGSPQVVDGAAALLQGTSLAAPADLEARLPAVATAVGDGIEAESDPHGPEDYKRHLAGVLAGRALRSAAAILGAPPRP